MMSMLRAVSRSLLCYRSRAFVILGPRMPAAMDQFCLCGRVESSRPIRARHRTTTLQVPVWGPRRCRAAPPLTVPLLFTQESVGVKERPVPVVERNRCSDRLLRKIACPGGAGNIPIVALKVRDDRPHVRTGIANDRIVASRLIWVSNNPVLDERIHRVRGFLVDACRCHFSPPSSTGRHSVRPVPNSHTSNMDRVPEPVVGCFADDLGDG